MDNIKLEGKEAHDQKVKTQENTLRSKLKICYLDKALGKPCFYLPLDILVGVRVVFGGRTGVDEALLLSMGGGRLLRGGGC